MTGIFRVTSEPMKIIRSIGIIIAFIFLTVLTQIGGIIYLISLTTYKFIDKRVTHKIGRGLVKTISFLTLYIICSFLIIPILARPFGRVPLPLTETGHIRPLNFLTCLLNRHYVRSDLREATMEVAKQMNSRFSGTVINYLDAGFPFMNGFPLIPHLSHNDGKKLDLAFCYIDNKTATTTNDVPSAIGYGISEEPRADEDNIANWCAQKGNWQYSILTKMVPQGNRLLYTFDSTRTKAMVNLFVLHPSIGKIFIEPHLKKRLQLTSQKIRFHGCQAVRHDDHLHVQLQ